MILPEFYELSYHEDHEIRRYTIESIGTIAHHIPHLIRSNIEKLQEICQTEVQFRKELMKEIDLGPFKLKTDEGRELRISAFNLLATMLNKAPDKLSSSIAIEIVLTGLHDADSDCQAHAL